MRIFPEAGQRPETMDLDPRQRVPVENPATPQDMQARTTAPTLIPNILRKTKTLTVTDRPTVTDRFARELPKVATNILKVYFK